MTVVIDNAEYAALLEARAERDALRAIINTPELIDFPKAVTLEAQHQEARWGTNDREGKQPYDWHWLVAHLAGRALAHHVEAERFQSEREWDQSNSHYSKFLGKQLAHHREKAVHHTITAAAALSHWHASIVGKHTAMRPGSADAASVATRLEKGTEAGQ